MLLVIALYCQIPFQIILIANQPTWKKRYDFGGYWGEHEDVDVDNHEHNRVLAEWNTFHQYHQQ